MAAEAPTYEVAREGDFPTQDEFERVWRALENVREDGIDSLLERICAPMVDAYESGERLTWTFADAGLLAARAGYLVEAAEFVLEKTKRLQQLIPDVAEAIDNDGKLECGVRFDRYGLGEYVASEEALERWGLKLTDALAQANDEVHLSTVRD